MDISDPVVSAIYPAAPDLQVAPLRWKELQVIVVVNAPIHITVTGGVVTAAVTSDIMKSHY